MFWRLSLSFIYFDGFRLYFCIDELHLILLASATTCVHITSGHAYYFAFASRCILVYVFSMAFKRLRCNSRLTAMRYVLA